MKTVTDAILVEDRTLVSVDSLQDLARAPLLYGPFGQEHMDEIWLLIRRNGKDNIVFGTADGDVYVLEARDFSAESKGWGAFAKKGESITIGALSGTVTAVDNEWFTDRNFEQNHSLAGLEAIAAKAREAK